MTHSPTHSTPHQVLLTMTVLMAPFTPFLTEFLYQRLRTLHPDYPSPSPPHNANANDALPLDALGKSDSVHYVMLPEPDEGRLDEECEVSPCWQFCVVVGKGQRWQSHTHTRTHTLTHTHAHTRTHACTQERMATLQRVIELGRMVSHRVTSKQSPWAWRWFLACLVG